MRKVLPLFAVLLALGAVPVAAQAPMKFFVTSAAGPDATDPRGISEADSYCSSLGYAAGYGDFEWRAYLDVPASGGRPAVKAKDRIGAGPWFNYEGVFIAENVEGLLSGDHNITRETALNERGYAAYPRANMPAPEELIKTGKPDANGLYFCFAR